MLEAKTKGNLDADEQRMLKDLLTSLQLNYVETSRTAVPSKPAPDAAPEAAPAAPTEPAKESGAASDEKRKFHKSYGE